MNWIRSRGRGRTLVDDRLGADEDFDVCLPLANEHRVHKHGAAFDLPILVGILAARGKLPGERCRRWAMVGDLGLDGSVRPVDGALPLALHARSVISVQDAGFPGPGPS